MIHVKYYGFMRTLTGVSEEQYEPVGAIDKLVRAVGAKHGKEAEKMAKRSFVLLNGKNVGLINGYKTKLSDGDIVQIMPVTAGG